MNEYQDKVYNIAEVLEEKGFHITIVDYEGFLQLYVNGERTSLINAVKFANQVTLSGRNPDRVPVRKQAY